MVSVLEMSLNGFCSLSSNLRAALVNGNIEDGQEKREHGFWQGNGVKECVCVDSMQKGE